MLASPSRLTRKTKIMLTTRCASLPEKAGAGGIDGVLIRATALITAHQAGPTTGQQPDRGTPIRTLAEQCKNEPHQPAKHRHRQVPSGKGGVEPIRPRSSRYLPCGTGGNTGKKVGILECRLLYGPSLPRLNRVTSLNLKVTAKKVCASQAWGLQTMSIRYLDDGDAPTI